jgi:hypothetical protein
MTKHPQNGPTFSKAPPKKRVALSDEQRVAAMDRKDAELAERKRTAARSRQLLQLLHNDKKSFLQALGLLKKD